MNWYELTEEERIKQVYSKYTIRDFWQWWSAGHNLVMEVRIKDFNLIKQTSQRFMLPYSSSGVYVNSDVQLKQVILFIRDKATVWYGINPRKKSINKWGQKAFGGTDSCVNNIHFIFIDIDRITKTDVATSDELSKCDKLARLIIERMEDSKWSNNYMLLCSGNGVQLVLRVDEPIILQNLTFKTVTVHEKTTYYAVNNDNFEKTKKIIVDGIGKDIKRFCDGFKDSLNVEVDRACFNIGRVGALPFTKNFKYNTFKWRGIVEINDGKNEGLSDYIMSKLKDIKTYKENSAFSKNKVLDEEYKIKGGGEFFNNPLVKFMITQNFPNGGINNTLWFSLKLLIRDSKIDIHSKEFIEFHNFIKQKHQRTFTLNLPNENFIFDERAINNYCINNMLPLVYPLKNRGQKQFDMCMEQIPFDSYKLIDEDVILKKETTIFEDINDFKLYLEEDNLIKNSTVIAKFIKGCITKYGIEKTKYFFDNVFRELFST